MAGSLAGLRAKLGQQGLQDTLKVNRLDAGHVRKGRALVIPEGYGDFLELSPFPRQLPSAARLPKLILISLEVQAFGAYESGRLVRWGPVNSGARKTPTPTGMYHANWRSIRKVSSLNRSWIMPYYLNIHTSMGLALHQYAMPGYPASHGCVRLQRDDAIWIYKWVDRWIRSAEAAFPLHYGTPIVIFGEYRFGQASPWSKLPEDPQATRLEVTEVSKTLAAYLPLLEKRALDRLQYAAGGDDPAGAVEPSGEEPNTGN